VTPRDPGSYDHDELEASILRGRLDIALLRARAWCDDPQAMCMYADWLLHRALAPARDEDVDELVDEARGWLRRAVRSGSLHAAGMLGDTLRLDVEADVADPAEARRWLMRAAARGDERSAELLASLEDE
jgi:TPR repeat protein